MKNCIMLICSLISVLSYSAKSHALEVVELGRALANYQQCSEVAARINDQAMVNYYQKMFNDASLPLLSYDVQQVGGIYEVWEKSEQILLKINPNSLQTLCLSRFDALSRKMQK